MSQNLDQLDALLAATPVFRKLSPQDRRTVALAATLKRYEKGQTISSRPCRRTPSTRSPRAA